METYSYIGLIKHLIEVESNNKVKTLIQLPWVSIYTNTKHLIEVETNNKVKTLIPQSQRKTATIFKTPIELPAVSIYNDIDIWYSFFKIGIHTQISHHTITKEICYNIENSNRMTLVSMHGKSNKKIKRSSKLKTQLN